MNQILATNNNGENNKKEIETEFEEKNNSYEKSYNFNSLNSYSEVDYSKNKRGSNDNKKIIIIFAICIIIFGIIIASLFFGKFNKDNKKVVIDKPKIQIEEEGNNANIVITTEGELYKVIYYWDKTEIKEINACGKKYESSIPIPNGESELYIKAIDSTNQETQTSQKFTRSFDEKEPVIQATPYGTGQIKITATDETSMDYITYKLGDDEETKVEPELEGDTKIEVIIDVPRGINKLYITAVDTSGNESYATPGLQGALTPTIDVKKSKNGKKLRVRISHDKGFKSVEIYFNGEITLYDEESQDYDENKDMLEYIFTLEKENKIAIVATSLEWDEENEEYTKQTFYGETTNEPENNIENDMDTE